ncbi:hypothetical protein GRF61_06370 [Azoarcus sp. TTM-91]|uniref:hypothetical protein n=1 Tax=Azoarcus sp. TTM-91 TaxID=2691581 RepID=UPI00145CCC6A|nr:hypothetical protein [Azoarcus sp. TTM-91]NMG34073.1 hypothetical protein [Azoarcus sp. TTM-91]
MASVLLLHIAAGLTLFAYASSFSIQDLFSMGLIALSACAAVRAEMAKAGINLVLQPDGSLKTARGGEIRMLRVQAGAVDFGFILWLSLVDDEARTTPWPLHLGVVSRNMKREEWRALRIWLRLLAFKQSADSA